MRQRPRRLHLDQRDVGVRIGADPLGPQAPAVGQPHHDPVGALDHVMVGQDVAIRIDDEAGPGAAARTFTLALRRAAEEVGAVGQRQSRRAGCGAADRARRRVDVDDRRIELLGDVGKRRRQPAPRSSASTDVARRTFGFVADCAGVGVSEPATIRPTRNATVAARHTVTTRNRRAIGIIIRLSARGFGRWMALTASVFCAISALNAASSSIGTPSVLRLVGLAARLPRRRSRPSSSC